jgi:hypothetical protein
MKISYLLCLLALLAGLCPSTYMSAKTSPAAPKLFQCVSAKGSGADEPGMSPPPAEFEFHALGRNILIKQTGTISAGKSRPRRLRLGVSNSDISGVCFAEYGHDLLLLAGVDDGEGAGVVFVRLDGISLHRKWRLAMPGLGIGPSVAENRFAFLTGGGFVGKVDLETGQFRWKHSTLAGSTVTFGSYGTPVIRENDVIFSEPEILSHPRSVTMDKRTGRVMIPPHYR